MPKNYNSPLDGVSFEDIMSEVDSGSSAVSVRPSRNGSSHSSGGSSEFRIVENFGKLSNRKNAATFALVEWNGNERYDLRAWNEDYTVPFKGLTLSAEEVVLLAQLLSDYVPQQYNKPLYEIDMGKTKAKIYCVITELSSATKKGVVWNKQVAIVDWGYGPKYDFRKWTEDYEKCSRGIGLTQSEIDTLLEILNNLAL